MQIIPVQISPLRVQCHAFSPISMAQGSLLGAGGAQLRFLRSVLRPGRIWLQNCAILRNALRMLNDLITQCQQQCATLQKQAQKLFLEL
jgi:hypothetical protein